MTYLGVWRSGTITEKRHQIMKQLSGRQSRECFSGFRKLSHSYTGSEATPPDVHLTSRYITACDDFFQTFPVLVLKATNAEVRSPGYEAKIIHVVYILPDM